MKVPNTFKRVIQAVPTNIITGFLGVGKTSTILHLLKNKPADERWAILVNEFGEIGVDGSLIDGQQAKESGVFISEVHGGCMCCAAGVPMQIALNQLLKSARPDRLLIEPTGLGHPKEVLEVLSSEHYQNVLSLQKTLTLVDARKLSDERYASHETFNQQVAIGDTIIGNKSDLYRDGDRAKLIEYIKQFGKSHENVDFAKQGNIDLKLLEGKTSFSSKYATVKNHQTSNAINVNPQLSKTPIPECGFIKAVNKGEGFESIGWRFSSRTVFDHDKINDFVKRCKAERLKAIFVTNKGKFGFNVDQDDLTKTVLLNHENSNKENDEESRIEIISTGLSDNFEDELMACILV